ncbi:hypothetical protein EXIGLDRAFT_762584 [Exidia glandulosa HHB12029]|uniref:F-box domain-containing protein n=1 Tax=Exidia glandulosa HHB12029 TaxID=1314781 RepID=A0A165MMV0_EXIGL|nr:hypothetical protein EXIGLDRAFT_762584 [Exidia glandulosa HHB12029]
MRLQRSVKKYKRARLPTLPISLLRRLLEHCDLLDRIALAQTCVTLRQAAQSIPALWCKFRIHDYSALHKASYLFHWSYPRLVDVALSLSMDGPLGALEKPCFPDLRPFN